MKKAIRTQVGKYAVRALIILGGILLATPVFAQIPAVYTNDNFMTSQHDRPVSFEQDEFGNFYGETLTGKTFSQINIANSLNIRLQKFSIDQAFFYVSDRGVIQAQTDIVALSIYLTLG